MNNPARFSPETFSVFDEEQAHLVCRRYEESLGGKKRLSLDRLLARVAKGSRPLAIYELVKLDAEWKRRRGIQPVPDDYASLIGSLEEDVPSGASDAPTDVLHAALRAALEHGAAGVRPVAASDATRLAQATPRTTSSVPAMSGALRPRVMPGRLGRYTIVGQLGQGGMGTVFRAYDARLKRYVALKVPHFCQSGDEGLRLRFRREALALAALRNDMIVPVHDVDFVDDYEFMTMALIEGEPLRRYVNRRRPLADHQAAILVRALAKAMDYVHQRGVIHRDLKPENVIMEDGRKPVIVDFGLARAPTARDQPLDAAPQELGRAVTRFGQIAGTPAYSSPEQLAGDFDAMGPSADVYSLGVMLFELLTGHVPVDGDCETLLLAHAVGNSRVPLACDWNPLVDPRLAEVCARAMARDARERFATMGTFASALHPHCKRSVDKTSPSVRPSRSCMSVAKGKKYAGGAEQGDVAWVLEEISRQATPVQTRRQLATRKETAGKRRTVACVVLVVAAAGVMAHFASIAHGPLRTQESPVALAQLASSRRAAHLRPSSGTESPLASNNLRFEEERAPAPVDGKSRVTRERPQGAPMASRPSLATPPTSTRPQPITARSAPNAARSFLRAGGLLTLENLSTEGDAVGVTLRAPSMLPPGEAHRVTGIVASLRDSAFDQLGLQTLLRTHRDALRRVELWNGRLEPETLAAIAALPWLERLTLFATSESGEIAEAFAHASFERMEHLDLGGNGIDASSLGRIFRSLAASRAPIKSLALQGAAGLDSGNFESLVQWNGLVALDLRDVPLPNAHVRYFERMGTLETLNLAGTGLTDDAVVGLVQATSGLSQLKQIDLSRTRMTATGLADLDSRLQRRKSGVSIYAGERIAMAFRAAPRRNALLHELEAPEELVPGVVNGLKWLVRNQRPNGSWSMCGPYADGAAVEDALAATSMALLALQGHGYDGLSDDEFDRAVRRGHAGLNAALIDAQKQGGRSPHAFALAAWSLCDLHALTGNRIENDDRLPQRAAIDAALVKTLSRQRDDGGWGDDQLSSPLITAWQVEALLAARAAGWNVDAATLAKAKRFLQSKWDDKARRYFHANLDRTRRIGVQGSHAVAMALLQEMDDEPHAAAWKILERRWATAREQPHYCYFGTRALVDRGGASWSRWRENVLRHGVLAQQERQGAELGSWAPSAQRTRQSLDDPNAAGRLSVTCHFLLSLEACYRRLPRSAPEIFRFLPATPTAHDQGPAQREAQLRQMQRQVENLDAVERTMAFTKSQ